MSDTSSTPVPDVRQTFGMFALGTILGTIFFGMTLFQAGLYFGRPRDSSTWLSSFVLVMTAIDMITWCLEVDVTWFYFVENYGKVEALGDVIWPLQLEPVFTYTAAFMTQVFFIHKIHILNRAKIYVGLFLFIMAFSAWALGLTIAGIVFHIHALDNDTIMRVNIAQKAVSTILEILIAGYMCYFFRGMRNGMQNTDNILQRLIVFAASRGVILGGIQVVYTGVYFGYPDKLIWVPFHFMLAKLCSNSVLASLNVREIIRGGRSQNSYELNAVVSSPPAMIPGMRSTQSELQFAPTDISKHTATLDGHFTNGIKVDTVTFQSV